MYMLRQELHMTGPVKSFFGAVTYIFWEALHMPGAVKTFPRLEWSFSGAVKLYSGPVKS